MSELTRDAPHRVSRTDWLHGEARCPRCGLHLDPRTAPTPSYWIVRSWRDYVESIDTASPLGYATTSSSTGAYGVLPTRHVSAYVAEEIGEEAAAPKGSA